MEIERDSKTRKNNFQITIINKRNQESKTESIYAGTDHAEALLEYLLDTE